MNNQITKSTPRDVFMHLLNIIGLYVSAGSVLTLLFQYVNTFFPDPLNPYFDPGDPIRWALASLIIIFPSFLWISRFLERDLRVNPAKSELRIRRWLLHFTLAAAAVIIIGDLVSLIYNFLQGELTIRFSLKILSVLIVAAAVFGYYLYDLRKRTGEFSERAKIFIWSVIVIVIALVIAGFFVAGSPFKARLIRFDNQRVSDLQNIQSQIVYYWQQKEKLPQTLDELRDSISGFAPSKDPEGGGPYAYKITSKLSFELCAKFNLDSKENQLGGRQAYPLIEPQPIKPFGPEDNWAHPSGEFCFKRTIDPELYKPIKR